MTRSSSETAVAAFFAAMNAQDADAAAALVDPDVEIKLGPQLLTGAEAVRELALQVDPQLVFETIPLGYETEGDQVDVVAKRVQRWRASGELAVDEEVRARFVLDSQGLIRRVELS